MASRRRRDVVPYERHAAQVAFYAHRRSHDIWPNGRIEITREVLDADGQPLPPGHKLPIKEIIDLGPFELWAGDDPDAGHITGIHSRRRWGQVPISV